jgi:hypothetical protein
LIVFIALTIWLVPYVVSASLTSEHRATGNSGAGEPFLGCIHRKLQQNGKQGVRFAMERRLEVGFETLNGKEAFKYWRCTPTERCLS